MSKKKKLRPLHFWIPFAGQNIEKLGTRIELDPDTDICFVSNIPEKHKQGDLKVANSGVGLQRIYEALSLRVAGHAEMETSFFIVCRDLLLNHQRC
jgi:hypothetical protein